MESCDIKAHFENCFNFIDKSMTEGSILIHCAAGISRSATIVIAFLMKKLGWSMEKAYKFTSLKRVQVSPNYGFLY